jgi:hypothetical protein
MGLDMYAYTAAKEQANYETEQREIAYWRKHPSLHGWMQRLWESRGNSGSFNGDELELTWEDLDLLEAVVKQRALPDTQGFFFGDSADDYYYQADLDFIKQARTELFSGLRVFYNSSW